MAYAIRYEKRTEAELREIGARDARRILDEVDLHLGGEPARPSRRKKMLEGLEPPWEQARPVWQLRVGEYRVFYDVDKDHHEVVVKAIRRKGSKTTEEIL